MAKSQIIIDLANDNISLDNAFRRLHLIAVDLGDKETESWILNELNGYNNNDQLPPYRIFGRGHIICTGKAGDAIFKRTPLPAGALSDETWESIAHNFIKDSISTIETWAKPKTDQKEEPMVDLTHLSYEVFNNTNMECFSIYACLGTQLFINMVSIIKTNLTLIFIQLEKDYGCLDELDIPTKTDKSDGLKNYVNNVVYENNSNSTISKNIITGNNNDIKNGNKINSAPKSNFLKNIYQSVLSSLIAQIIISILALTGFLSIIEKSLKLI